MAPLVNSIYPIHCSNNEEGCGFFIGHKFFTSGHVINRMDNPYIEVCGERVYLTNSTFYRSNEHDENDYDIAIFDIPSFYGRLDLFEEAITSGIVLKSISYKSTNLGKEPVETDVVIGVQKGNYFSGVSKANLKSGSSGSPVLIGNKVVGILTKGNNNDHNKPCIPELPLNFCFFLSSKAIRKILPI